MTLTQEELQKLQRLSAISLEWPEQEKFKSQLWDIINFLGELDQLDLSDIDTELESQGLTLRAIEWIEECDDDLLQNVEHEVINNSVVIKSVLG